MADKVSTEAIGKAVAKADGAIEEQIKLLAPKITTMIDEKLEARLLEANKSEEILNRIFTPEALQQLKGKKEKAPV